jgi:hypothetical protein
MKMVAKELSGAEKLQKDINARMQNTAKGLIGDALSATDKMLKLSLLPLAVPLAAIERSIDQAISTGFEPLLRVVTGMGKMLGVLIMPLVNLFIPTVLALTRVLMPVAIMMNKIFQPLLKLMLNWEKLTPQQQAQTALVIPEPFKTLFLGAKALENIVDTLIPMKEEKGTISEESTITAAREKEEAEKKKEVPEEKKELTIPVITFDDIFKYIGLAVTNPELVIPVISFDAIMEFIGLKKDSMNGFPPDDLKVMGDDLKTEVETAKENTRTYANVIYEFFIDPIWDLWKGIVEDLFNKWAAFLKWSVKFIEEDLPEAWDKLKTKWDELTTEFNKWLTPIGGILSALTDVSNNIIKWFTDAVTSMVIDMFGGGEGEGGGAVHTDFIMRPGQPAASFSPDDTIIGVKNPESLGGGGSYTFNLTINGSNLNQKETELAVRDAIESFMSDSSRRGFFQKGW